MTALRADGFGGHVEFDGEIVKIGRKGLGRAAKESREFALADVEWIDFVAATRLSNGHIRFAIPGQVAKSSINDQNCAFFTRKQSPDFDALRLELVRILDARGALSAEQISAIEGAHQKGLSETRKAHLLEIEALKRRSAGATYAGHIVDYKGYRYGLGVKRPIAGATAEFESGADRSRPTLTRIGSGALLAGPVGAIAGGMFKKDKTKGYVTIVFPDGASVIVEGPAKDEKKMRAFAQGVNAIAEAEQRRENGPDTPEPVAGGDAAESLLKLKQLLDAGVLDQAQYDEKAAPLIAQL